MIHSLTTLVMAAVLFVILPLLVWWVTAGQLRRAVGWWCAGSVLAAVGLAFSGLRPWLPAWMSYNLANSCLILSLVGWAQSLRTLQGRAWSMRQMGLWVLLALAFYSALLAWTTANTRGLGMRTALGGLALYTAWLTLPLARRWHSHNAVLIGVCYGVLGLGLLGQMLLHSGGGQHPSPFSNTWDAGTLALLTLATSVLGHLGFTGVVTEHAMQSQLAAERARVAAEETARLQGRLQQQDRQQRLLLVSGALAHELNQPMTMALTHAQVVQRQLSHAAWSAKAMQISLMKAQGALERASGVLDVIRRAGSAQPLQLQTLDLQTVLSSTLQCFEEEWQQLGVLCHMAPPGEPVWCQGDEVALSQVLMNLMRNATQAVEGGAHRALEVHWVLTPETVCIELRDSGPGVTAEVLAQWGEPFVSTRQQEEGLGMGLAISRLIMAQHGGELRLCNRAEGGAQASVCLPRAAAPTGVSVSPGQEGCTA